MKAGIMTFHWAANHGAVLQTYSLAKYLMEKYGIDVEIINYYPHNLEISFYNAIRTIKPRSLCRKLKELKKESAIKPFRSSLPLTHRFYTNDELREAKFDYDIIFAGSDQIWNPYFLMNGENKITPAYYLDFANNKARKIAISASFGCYNFPNECKSIVVPFLNRFYAISVREKTGLDILNSMGVSNGNLTADPTALITRDEYLKLCVQDSKFKPGCISKFILRNQTSETNKLIENICCAYSKEKAIDIEIYPIPEWLTAIRDSKMVVTNSFHCVMMCLKLHTHFVVVLENGTNAGMNDRFWTLLNTFGLTDRIVSDISDINRITGDIDFIKIDALMKKYSETLECFIERNIHINE